MKALVVEPSKMYQLLFNEFLNGFSISHDTVTTAKEALAELAQEQVDLVIVAMNLADGMATSLAKQIKSQAQYAETVIIVMTGEQKTEKLEQMKTAEISHICQRQELEQLKEILTKLTRNDLSISQVSGHILYIEDHLTIANMTMDILQQMGLTFEHCSSAEQGLTLFEENNYDLVLSDIVLAGEKDGIDMIREIRARGDDKKLIPMLAMSATTKASERIHALKVGANDFIVKPIIQAELAVRVKNLIVARQLHLKIISQQHALEELAMTDQLTGLYNRYFLNSFIEKALSLAKRHKYPLSIIMIDLDKFKHINDTFGHEQGDEVLVKIASVLQRSCRLEDIAVRLGGDEFLVVLPHCGENNVITKANEICQKVHAIEASHADVIVAASFGISSTEQGSFNYKALFDLADQAAYQAKAQGGNCVCCIEDDVEKVAL
jgi:two-component system cell cycle response regulator